MQWVTKLQNDTTMLSTVSMYFNTMAKDDFYLL